MSCCPTKGSKNTGVQESTQIIRREGTPPRFRHSPDTINYARNFGGSSSTTEQSSQSRTARNLDSSKLHKDTTSQNVPPPPQSTYGGLTAEQIAWTAGKYK